MSCVFPCVEFFATFVESVMAISLVTTAAEPKFHGKKYLLSVGTVSFFLSLAIYALNQIQVFSFLTIFISIASVTFLTKLTSQKGILIRATACLVTYCILHARDYILLFCMGLLTEGTPDSAYTFQTFMEPGILRFLYVSLARVSDTVIYFPVCRALRKTAKLPKSFCFLLLSTTMCFYIVMSVLLNLLMDRFLFSAQVTAIISWIFIVLCLALVFSVLIIVSSYQQERSRHEILQVANIMMADNYQQLHQEQSTYAKQIHDFKHHLTALRGLTASGKAEQAIAYMDSLLSTAYQESILCHSGNDIVDAIINRKKAEAEENGISFQFNARLDESVSLDPVDICGALANQIDNALNACSAMPPSMFREIIVEVRQVENFALFRVENTVDHDPFYNNKFLVSTKARSSLPHGLGLKNIKDIADKYDGSFRSEYHDGRFVSALSLCYQPLDT